MRFSFKDPDATSDSFSVVIEAVSTSCVKVLGTNRGPRMSSLVSKILISFVSLLGCSWKDVLFACIYSQSPIFIHLLCST